MDCRFAVLSRIHRIERPFLSGFFPHYLDRLGFDRIFLVRGDSGNSDWLETDLASGPYHDRVEVLFPRSLENVNKTLLEFMPILAKRCDWIQLADLDEYLYLGGRRIDEVMAEHDARKEVHFRWLMMPTAAESPSGFAEVIDSASIFPKMITKAIFRPQGVRQLSAHQALWHRSLKKEESFIHEITAPVSSNCFQYHFCSRGLFDILLKSIWQQFGTENPKTANIAALKRFLARRGDVDNAREVPTRFLMLMIQMMESRSEEPRSQRIAAIAKQLFGGIRFDTRMLAAMVEESLDRLEVTMPVKRGIFEERLLTECLERITGRFWDDRILLDAKKLNYLNTVRKIRGEID